MEQVVPVVFFWEMVFCGAVFVLVYDWFRIIRRILPHGNLWCWVEDIFFLIGCFLVLFRQFYLRYNTGPRVIWYVALGVGIFLYWVAISRPLMAIISKGIFSLKQTLKKIKKEHRMKREKSIRDT